MLTTLYRHPRFSGYLLGVIGEGDTPVRYYGVQGTGSSGFTVVEEDPASKIWANDLRLAHLSELEPKAADAIYRYFRAKSLSVVSGVRPDGEVSAAATCLICGNRIAEAYNPGCTQPVRSVHIGGACIPPKASVLFIRELWGLSNADTRELAAFASKVFGSNPQVVTVLFQYRMTGRVDRADSCGEGLVRVGVEAYQF